MHFFAYCLGGKAERRLTFGLPLSQERSCLTLLAEQLIQPEQDQSKCELHELPAELHTEGLCRRSHRQR